MPSAVEGAESPGGELLAGRYRLLERIGAGGMGHVYRARDEVLERDVAVKRFSVDPSDRVSAVRRASEARLQATFDHPSLATLFDAQVDSGENSFLVMELVPGQTLHDRLAQNALTGEEVVALIIGLASALAVVHHAGTSSIAISSLRTCCCARSDTESSRSGRFSWTSASHTSSTQPASPRPGS